MNCRHCNNKLEHVFLDLGFAPPSNAYLTLKDLQKPERYFPLKLFVCEKCWLVQTEDYAGREDLFDDSYAYFSSISKSWLKHSEDYTKMIIPLLGLNQSSFVVEIASNDGYLLKNFVTAGIPCLGIEPTSSTADVAEKNGVPVLRKFFGENVGTELSEKGNKADLIIGNNVFAHVPDINDFTRGLKSLLKSNGTISLEFPHILNLIYNSQFDTVYHEHYSYLSLHSVVSIFNSADLRIFNIEELPTHGGSLRIYGCHKNDPRKNSNNVASILRNEVEFGLHNLKTYTSFQDKVNLLKNEFLSFLVENRLKEKKIGAYGAAAKGVTLLNYAGVKPDLLPFICDAAPSKQGKFLPGSHIPILNEEIIKSSKPEYVIIFPWNLKDEIVNQLSYIRDWDGKFIVFVPKIEIF
jgi:SAM-dependent methyltransferase